MKALKIAIALFILTNITLHPCRSEDSYVPGSPEGDATRELLGELALDGSSDSYAMIEQIMTDPDELALLFHGNDGPRLGSRKIDDTMEIIGDRNDEASYELLKNLFEAPISVNRNSISTPVLSNLLKYRDTKNDEILDLIESRLIQSHQEVQEIQEAYPFLKRDDVYFTEKYQYVDAQGNLIHKGRLYSGSEVNPVHMINALYLFDNERSFRMMQDYFSTGRSRESVKGVENEVQIQLKERRYEPLIIDIYEALIVDERYTDSLRSMVVTHFFDNSDFLYRYYVREKGKEGYIPKISDASEEALLRILELADYALTLDFLPQETLDLVYEKRAEVIDRLEELGHDPEWLRVEGPKTEVIEIKASSPATDAEATEPTEEPQSLNTAKQEIDPVDSETDEINQQNGKRLITWFVIFILIIGAIFILYFLFRKRK